MKYRSLWQESPMEILLEEAVEIGGSLYMTGHSKEYIRVAVKDCPAAVNETVVVKSLGQVEGEFLICEM